MGEVGRGIGGTSSAYSTSMARRESSTSGFDPTYIRQGAVPSDETAFGPLVMDVAQALATPSALPAVVEDEDPHEVCTVLDFSEPSLPVESVERRIKTDQIRARRKDAVAAAHSKSARPEYTPTPPPAPVPASIAPRIEPADTKKLPPPARRAPRRPTVPAKRAPSDWAHDRTMFEPEPDGMPQRFIGTTLMPNPVTGAAPLSDARVWSLTATSMLMSAIAGVFLAAALANLVG